MKVVLLSKKSKALLCSGDASSGTGSVSRKKEAKKSVGVKVLSKKSKALLCSGDASSGTGSVSK